VAKARVESPSHRDCKYAGGAAHRRSAPGAGSRDGRLNECVNHHNRGSVGND